MTISLNQKCYSQLSREEITALILDYRETSSAKTKNKIAYSYMRYAKWLAGNFGRGIGDDAEAFSLAMLAINTAIDIVEPNLGSISTIARAIYRTEISNAIAKSERRGAISVELWETCYDNDEPCEVMEKAKLLPYNEMRIVRLSLQGCSQTEIARMFGLSKQRIKQIYDSAVKKLRLLLD